MYLGVMGFDHKFGVTGSEGLGSLAGTMYDPHVPIWACVFFSVIASLRSDTSAADNTSA
jgi:hypothetical protein